MEVNINTAKYSSLHLSFGVNHSYAQEVNANNSCHMYYKINPDGNKTSLFQWNWMEQLQITGILQKIVYPLDSLLLYDSIQIGFESYGNDHEFDDICRIWDIYLYGTFLPPSTQPTNAPTILMDNPTTTPAKSPANSPIPFIVIAILLIVIIVILTAVYLYLKRKRNINFKDGSYDAPLVSNKGTCIFYHGIWCIF